MCTKSRGQKLNSVMCAPCCMFRPPFLISFLSLEHIFLSLPSFPLTSPFFLSSLHPSIPSFSLISLLLRKLFIPSVFIPPPSFSFLLFVLFSLYPSFCSSSSSSLFSQASFLPIPSTFPPSSSPLQARSARRKGGNYSNGSGAKN